MTKPGYKQTPEHIARRITSGPDHPRWQGDAVSEVEAAATARRAQTHCKRGHPLSGPNLYITRQGTRYCKIHKRNHRNGVPTT